MSKQQSDLIVMDAMATANEDIRCSTTLVGFQTVKAGGHITMGIDAATIKKQAVDNSYIPILYMVNRLQFQQRKSVLVTEADQAAGLLSLALKVKEIRDLQKQYFLSRKGRYGDKKLLGAAKDAEKQLDVMVATVLDSVTL